MKPLSVRRTASCLASLAFLAATPLVHAQYKVVEQDGSVTYTDRPPVASNARISNIGRGGARSTVTDIGLPLELRTAVQRHPVTLYTGAECAPCDAARRLLLRRGIPYSERRVSTEDDAAALDRLVGGRTVPSLMVGAQPLRGLSETDWNAYLDAAGYPRESLLPRGWQAPEPMPVVERSTPTPRAAAPAPAAPPEARPAERAPTPGTIRF